MKRYVIIVAGGKGLRMGGDLPKQFIPMAGKPILMHTVEKFWRWDNQMNIILVLPMDHQAYWKMLCKEIGCKAPHRIVNGGETRFHSVQNGLNAIREEIEASGEKALIAVHDGVRPFVSPEVIAACFAKAEETGAVVPALPMIDSLRMKQADGSSCPVDRSLYYAVHTPQVFASDILIRAYQQPYTDTFTDDASVVEAAGFQVAMVLSNRENIKITTPFDLMVARALFQE